MDTRPRLTSLWTDRDLHVAVVALRRRQMAHHGLSWKEDLLLDRVWSELRTRHRRRPVRRRCECVYCHTPWGGF